VGQAFKNRIRGGRDSLYQCLKIGPRGPKRGVKQSGAAKKDKYLFGMDIGRDK
jgi:hypothetical protein